MNSKVLGGALIIAGTAVGSGMLSMPLTSAGMGFGLTFLLLSILWILLTYTAFLFIELHQYEPNSAGIATLASRYFGNNGRLIVDFTLIIFMYALLTAYMTGGGSLIHQFIPDNIASDPNNAKKISSLIYALVFGAIISFGVRVADITNRLFFTIKMITFITVLYLLMSNITLDHLQAKPVNHLLFFSGASIFFMAFGFHICIPTVNELVGGNSRQLKIAIILGSFAILIIYLIWQLATHGVLEQSTLLGILSENPDLSNLIRSFEITTGSRKISEIVRIFSILAVTTSFIGAALGLTNAIKNLLLRFNLPTNNFIIGALTFVPPIIVGSTYPNIFLSTLAYAGAIFAFIGVILPAILAYKSRQKYSEGVRTWGGTPAIVIALIMGLIILITPFLVTLKLLPPVVG